MKIRWLAIAKREFDETVLWYYEKMPTLPSRFIDEVELVIAQIKKFPESGPRASAGCRSVLVPGFPYAVVFRKYPEAIVIVAVAHLKRRPGFWAKRVRDISR